MSTITLAELTNFHSIDREIFTRLIIPLKREPAQSLLVLALWLWLEGIHKCHIVYNLTKLSNTLLDAIADESALCLNILKSRTTTIHCGSLYLMSSVIGQQITLPTISLLKYSAISGVKTYLNNVCAWVFTDILLRVLPPTTNIYPSNNNNNNSPSIIIILPGFPHNTFGPFQVQVLPLNVRVPSENQLGWKKELKAEADDRMVFLTFSRGFPVSEEEAKRFFTQMCGDCIEKFEMEEVKDEMGQSLYARMLLKSVEYMDQIMGGKYLAKFRSNGKHIWARKFEKRDNHLRFG